MKVLDNKQPMQKTDLPTIAIDTREQHPWVFEGHTTIQRALTTGDYSIVGYEDKITIERKSIDDWVNTITHCRERFAEEVERMKGFSEAYIIIEADISNLLMGTYTRAQTNPPEMIFIRTLAFIKANPHVLVVFAGQRWHAVSIAREVLLNFARRARAIDEVAK